VTPGKLVRRLLGDRIFASVVRVYRAIYVDLDAVAECIPVLPPGAELLDVGGGDGALLDHLLRRQPHLNASIVDLEASVGLSLVGDRRERVRLFSSMASMRECLSRGVPYPDGIVIADVLHHIPVAARESFLRDVAAFAGPSLRFVAVKEVAPVGWRAGLGLLSDRYVTGDRHAQLLSQDEATDLVQKAFPQLAPRTTTLFERDAPNYCVIFEAGVRQEARRPVPEERVFAYPGGTARRRAVSPD
jgi:2-polyprenyl-6-hydroxyphenyl methylase/3-demethylubiquinone-9 3-methyltransferase